MTFILPRHFPAALIIFVGGAGNPSLPRKAGRGGDLNYSEYNLTTKRRKVSAEWFHYSTYSKYSKYKEPDVPGQPDSGEMSPTKFADGVVSGKEKKYYNCCLKYQITYFYS